MDNFSIRACALFVCLCMPAVAHAQLTMKYFYDGIDSTHYKGSKVSAAGDVDGDGTPDFMISTPGILSYYLSTGYVTVYSGATGGVLHSLVGAVPGDRFGFDVSEAGDVNNDGFDDFIVGIPHDATNGLYSGAAMVYSGVDGSVLYTYQGNAAGRAVGFSVAGLGDINNDGFDDFAVGKPSATPSSLSAPGTGRITVYSGIDGSVIRAHVGVAGSQMGEEIANAGDVDGDGVNDILAGQPRFQTNASTGGSRGRTQVFSGADGTLLHTVTGTLATDIAGVSVDGVGDVNGDGLADFIVGAGGGSASVISAIGSAKVFSGADASVLFQVENDISFTIFAENVAGLGDVNGDGVGDFSVTHGGRLSQNGSPPAIKPTIMVFSGVDYSLIAKLPASPSARSQSADRIGDINGDGMSDIVVGSFHQNGTPDGGSVRAFLGGTLPVSTYASDSGNSAQLSLAWLPDDQNINEVSGILRCSGATPGALGLVLVSLAPADIPIFGFDLLVAVDPINFLLSAVVSANVAGDYVVPEISRRNPAIAGSTTHIQFVQTSGILRASNGIQIIAIP